MATRARRLREALSHPAWVPARLRARRAARARRSSPSDSFSLADHEGLVRSEADAVRAVTGASEGEYGEAAAAVRIPSPVPEDETAWESRVVLLRMLATIVRLVRPEVAVEIGVERGYSSTVILEAMEEAGRGRLRSIDLPRADAAAADFVGMVIPERLRERWDLALGPSRQKLGAVLAAAGPVDLFLHDGDHSYESQLEDLRIAWPRVRPGGVVLVDDVWSPAFIEFAGEVGERPSLVVRWDEHDAIGMLRRSG